MSLFAEGNPWIFVLLTVVLGGGAAFMAGRSLAKGWQSIWLLVIYMVLFTAGIRFLHYALFQYTLTSLHYFISDGIILIAAALLGYRLTRVSQMVRQYPWLYERSGPFAWRSKG
jgi:hypothetical protein